MEASFLTYHLAAFFDELGNEVDLNDVDEITKRQSRWRLAKKFARLIAKWGKRAWDYIYCVGASSMWRCGDEVSFLFSVMMQLC